MILIIPHLLFIAFCFLFTYLLLLTYLITYLVDEAMCLPPSPFLCLPIVGHPYIYLFPPQEPPHLTLTRLGRRHGPVVLLQFGSRRVLHVSSPSAAQDCIATTNRPRRIPREHVGYNYTGRNLGSVASSEILPIHRLQMFSDVPSDEVKLFVVRMIMGNLMNNPIDLKSCFLELILNVKTRMIAGKRYFGKENAEEEQEARRFREIVMETFQIGAGTNVIWEFFPSCLRKLAGFKGIEKQMLELNANLDDFMLSMIEKHRNRAVNSQEEDGNKTLIQVLLNLRETDPETYEDGTIKSLMQDFLIAGTVTTAGTMAWAMSFLLNHPEVLEKAQNELDTVVGDGRLVNESDLSKLPYLHCIIKETLRIKPVSPLLIIPHESSEKCLVGGYRIPERTMLCINVHAIRTDPQLWTEPDKFKPERFENIQNDGFKLMPFGSGRSGCPGEINLAMKMIGMTLGSLLQCFEWERISKEMVDLTEGTGLATWKARPLLAKWMSNLLKQN